MGGAWSERLRRKFPPGGAAPEAQPESGVQEGLRLGVPLFPPPRPHPASWALAEEAPAFQVRAQHFLPQPRPDLNVQAPATSGAELQAAAVALPGPHSGGVLESSESSASQTPTQRVTRPHSHPTTSPCLPGEAVFAGQWLEEEGPSLLASHCEK